MKQRSHAHLLALAALCAGAACLVPSLAGAQQPDARHGLPVATDAAHHAARGAKETNAIPEESRPPKGMCRIWLSDVPASQQPAATDCATAVRNRPQNGRVIFGDDYSRAKSDSLHKATPAAKGFLEMKKPLGPPVFRKPPA